MEETRTEDLLTPASRIRRARKMRGLKQAELVMAAGISSGYLSQLEQGDNDSEDVAKIKVPGSEIARAIARALNVPVVWILYGEGPEPTWESPSGGAAA